MTAPPQYQNSLLALITPNVASLTTQPPLPSASELRARRRTLLGLQLPAKQKGNTLAAGTVLTIRGPADLRRVTANPQMLGPSSSEGCTFPTAIHLNAPWSLGAPGHRTEIWLALALLVQVTTGLYPCSVSPGPDNVRACDFTICCRRETPEYSTDFATDDEQSLPNGRRRQLWWLWQVCANCLAVRAVGRCTSWGDAIAVTTPIRVFDLGPGEESEWDRAYGWFNESWRDRMLHQSLGFYDLWTGRDGVARREASM